MRRAALFASAALAVAACGQPAAVDPAREAAAAPPAPDAAQASAQTPAQTPTQTPAPPPAGLEAALRRLNTDGGELRYAWAPVDLNGDGTQEALAYVVGPMACGSGGCSLYVLAPDAADWRVVTRTTVTQTPIGVLSASTNGWRDLAVSVRGGGAPAGGVRLAFDGRGYPTNPTTAPATPLEGQPDVTTMIAADPEFRPLP